MKISISTKDTIITAVEAIIASFLAPIVIGLSLALIGGVIGFLLY